MKILEQSLFQVFTKKTWKHLYMHPNFHRSVIYGGQHMETTEMSFGKWLD